MLMRSWFNAFLVCVIWGIFIGAVLGGTALAIHRITT